MELRLLTRDQINVVHWDLLIKESQYSIFYAYHWYLDVVCKDWQAIVWQVGIHYQMVLPLPIKRKWGMVSIEQPLFCPYLGIFSRGDITPIQLKCFFKILHQNFRYISNYQFKTQESGALLALLAGDDRIDFKVRTTYTISLEKPHETIYAAYAKDKKVNIRKSRACKLQITDSVDIEPLIQLFKENHADHIVGGVSEYAYILLREVFNVLRKHATVELRYALSDNKIVSGVLFAELEGYACYLFNAADQEGRIYNVRSSFLDDYFNRMSNSNLIFDFESPTKTTVANYYKSFGASPQHFLEISKNGLPFPFRQIQNLRKLFYRTRLLQKL